VACPTATGRNSWAAHCSRFMAGSGHSGVGGIAMPEKSMKEKFAAGELVLCMNLRLARSVDIAMVAKAGGYDALYVDMQHAPYSIETTATICGASLGIGITPLVRVPN